jgi:hypothetical protein
MRNDRPSDDNPSPKKPKRDGPEAGNSDAAKDDAWPSAPSKEFPPQSTRGMAPSSNKVNSNTDRRDKMVKSLVTTRLLKRP